MCDCRLCRGVVTHIAATTYRWVHLSGTWWSIEVQS